MRANGWIKAAVGEAVDKNNNRLLESKLTAYLSEMGSGLFAWYPFDKDAKVLQLSGWFGVHAFFLSSKVKEWTIIEQDDESCKITSKRVESIANIRVINSDFTNYLEEEKEKYDYVILAIDEWADTYENINQYEELLIQCKKVLAAKGHVLFVVPNRLGAKYLCGTATAEGSAFDGITDDWARPIRLTKAQLERLSNKVPYANYRVYHPYFDAHFVQAVYAEIEPDKTIRDKISLFHEQQTRRLLDEAVLVDHFTDNRIMNNFCNSLFVDYSDGAVCDIDYAAVSIERPSKNAMATVIHGKQYVEKRFIFPEGAEGIKNLLENHDSLKEHGINVLPLEKTEQGAKMPYINHETVMKHVHELVDNGADVADVFSIIDRFISDMRKASDASTDINPVFLKYEDSDFWGASRKVVYTEMIPNNCFFVEGEFLYFDQEFKIRNCPEVFLLYRIVRDIYHFVPEINDVISFDELTEKYGIKKCWDYCREIEEDFQYKLRQYDKYEGFWHWIFPSKREMMRKRSLVSMVNYANEEDLFDIDSIAEEQVVLFGTGRRAEAFFEKYGSRLSIRYCVDNNPDRWNNSFHGLEIKSPNSLVTLPKDGYYIVMAIKEYQPMLEQLERLDIGLSCVKIFRNS